MNVPKQFNECTIEVVLLTNRPYLLKTLEYHLYKDWIIKNNDKDKNLFFWVVFIAKLYYNKWT